MLFLVASNALESLPDRAGIVSKRTGLRICACSQFSLFRHCTWVVALCIALESFLLLLLVLFSGFW